MSESHETPPKPSPSIALVAFGIVVRLHPAWAAVDIKDAAADEGVSAERLSRLVSRAVTPFEQVLTTLTRRGRPPVDRAVGALQAELSLAHALLDVARAILEKLPLRRRAVGALVAGAWLRLHGMPGLTQQRFCQALAIPQRTLRSWLSTAPRRSPCPEEPLVEPTPPPPRPRSRPPRRPRFCFDLVLPHTQLAADTTDVTAFGVPLKLVAAQDVGGRDQDLLDSVVVDDHESAGLVVRALADALAGLQGAQVLTDQGTPYMAKETTRALDELEAEHAPQREGDPRAKATIERAFETVKAVAGPLLALTDRLAALVPALRDATLARAAARLVVTTVLRAYQHGARSARRALDSRAGLSPDELVRLAARHREDARATDRSSRLLLGHVHDLFALPGARKTFVDALRRYPLEVLHRAEQAFRSQVHRDDIRDRRSYFAALVRRFNDDHRRDRARLERENAERHRLNAQHAADEARSAARRSSPAAFLREALEAIAAMWRPERGELLCGGAGLGTGWLGRALLALVDHHGSDVARDVARGVFADFAHDWTERLGAPGLAAVDHCLQAKLDELCPRDTRGPCQPIVASITLEPAGLKQRPPPSAALRFLAARPVGS